jgi:hypothetical protein
MLQGYLTQRPARGEGEGEGGFDVDVTAEEFFMGSRPAPQVREIPAAPGTGEEECAS